MKAIYGNKLYTISRDTGHGVELEPEDDPTWNANTIFYVGYNDHELTLNPTNQDIDNLLKLSVDSKT